MTKSITITSTIADLATRLGKDVASYGSFDYETEVIVHANGQALALDDGQAVELDSDHAAVREAYAGDFAPHFVSLAAIKLDASPYGLSESWIYRADETGLDYVVSVEDMANLGGRLARNEKDAYSLWCAETDNNELTELNGWVVGYEYEAGDIAADYDVGAILAVRREGVDGVEVQIGWRSGVQTWQKPDGLREVGTFVPEGA